MTDSKVANLRWMACLWIMGENDDDSRICGLRHVILSVYLLLYIIMYGDALSTSARALNLGPDGNHTGKVPLHR